MILYERGNAAKQWMLEELDRRFSQSGVRVLDLGCGDASKWPPFLATHPTFHIVGVDTDRVAIERGRAAVPSIQDRLELRVADAQQPLEEGAYGAVVAMSAIEHVVDRVAFLKTVWKSLSPGGVAYLNYDVGHFQSMDWKERLMVPVSQLLAKVGIEGPYMKKVDDAAFRRQAEALGFRIVETRKHNLASLKGLMRGASDEAIAAWFDYEQLLSHQFSLEQLDRVMLSTTLVVEKP